MKAKAQINKRPGTEPALRERRVTAILALGGIGVTLGIALCAVVAGAGGRT
jgi:hypothetical protein